MMITARYALPVVLLLFLTAIPTVIHSYLDLSQDDGVQLKMLNPELQGFTSSPSSRNPDYGRDQFDSVDWTEHIYTNGSKTLRLFIAKGYDHKKLYHHPELALSYHQDLRSIGRISLKNRPDVVITVLNHANEPKSAAYALLYDGKFIGNPISHQISASISLLASAKKPMILFYAADDDSPKGVPFADTALAALLIKAVDTYQAKALDD